RDKLVTGVQTCALPISPINLYFTRRVIDPQFGLRLTGKLGEWNLGLLSIDDQAPGRIVPDGDPNRHKRAFFNIARITHDIGKQRSEERRVGKEWRRRWR